MFPLPFRWACRCDTCRDEIRPYLPLVRSVVADALFGWRP